MEERLYAVSVVYGAVLEQSLLDKVVYFHKLNNINT